MPIITAKRDELNVAAVACYQGENGFEEQAIAQLLPVDFALAE